jgi:Tfp pilus assembly protein PilF
VWDNLLQPYLWLGQKEKAEAAKQNATKLLAEFLVQHPQDADALAQSAIFYAQDHLRDKALNELNGALVLSPNDSDVLMCAAEVYESLGDHARALEYAHKSLSNGGTLDDLRNRYVLRELASDASFQGPGK